MNRENLIAVHEQTVSESWADQVAALNKLETEIEAIRASLGNAITAEQNLTLDEQLIQVIEKRLELWRGSIGEY